MDRNTIKISHHPYFTRSEIVQSGIESQKRLYDKYTLHSIARNNIVGQQIFLFYFSDIFSKHQQKQRATLKRIDQKHFSSFFMAFTKIFAYKSLISNQISCTAFVKAILNDLFRQSQQAIRSNRHVFIERHLNEFIQDYIQKYNAKSSEERTYLKKAIDIDQKITNIIKQLEQYLQDQNRFNKMLQQQYYHDLLPQEKLTRTIINNFKCISNIQTMRRFFKKDIWQEFQQIVKHHMPVIIDILSKQTPLEGYDTLYLPSYSREIEPIFSPLINYLQNLHRSNPNKLILAELSKSIVGYCAKFHNNTKNYYPRISTRDIYMDMKKLTPVISHNSLILDAIGLTKNTKSYELKLVTEQTPFFDFEETYLETDRMTMLKLSRKYYEPYNCNEINEDRISNSQKLLIYLQQLALLQQIHVGRLINIIYFISNNRHFGHDYYKGKFHQSPASPKPLYFKYYAQALKECYERLCDGQLTLEKIIPLPGLATSNNTQLLPKSTLGFQRLTAHFGLQFDDDSLLKGLKSQRFKQQIHQRHLIMKQLALLIFGKSTIGFKKLSNPVKYLLFYFTTNFQELRYLLQYRNEMVKFSRDMKGPNGYEFQRLIKAQAIACMRQEMNIDIHKVSLSKEQAKKKKTIKDAYNKIQDYQVRKDSSGEFFKNNPHYLIKIEEINRDFEQIYSLLRLEEDLIMEFQGKHSQLIYELDEIDCAFASKHEEIDELVHQVLTFRGGDKSQPSQEKLGSIMKQFKLYLDKQITTKLQELDKNLFQIINSSIKAQIEQNFTKPQKLHECPDDLKKNSARQLEYCIYFNLKFKALIKVLLTLNPTNSRKYRSIFRSHLLDDKVMSSKQSSNAKISVQPDISVSIKRMEMIIQKCEAELEK